MTGMFTAQIDIGQALEADRKDDEVCTRHAIVRLHISVQSRTNAISIEAQSLESLLETVQTCLVALKPNIQ